MPADCYILSLVIKSPQNKTHVVLVAGYVKGIKTVWSTARSCKFFLSFACGRLLRRVIYVLDFAKERTCEKRKSGFIFMESHSIKFKFFF